VKNNVTKLVHDSTIGVFLIELRKPMPLNLSLKEKCKWFRENAFVYDANDTVAKNYGYKNRYEVIGKTFFEVIKFNTKIHDEVIGIYDKSNYLIENKEIRTVDQNGNIFYHLDNSIPKIIDNHLYSIFGLSSNITEIKKFEQKLKEANTTKDKFFRIIGHDLKNPISQVVQISQLIETKHDKLSSEKVEEYAKTIKDSSIRTLNLLDNLLKWAMTQTNSISFNPVDIKLKILVDENIEILKELSLEKKIEMHNNIDESLILTADHNMISTVLRNLLSNAIKYSFENSSITIENSMDSKGNVISVADCGKGVSVRGKEKLFRVDSGFFMLGTKGEKGTGIGLILCKEFIEMHKGEIWVESEEGKGTTFYFSIPK